MEPSDVFRQGLGSFTPRQNNNHNQPPKRPPSSRDDPSESEGSSHRIAHTLTACCRCRQRKTRCDPTLPRCLPCERSGSTCEYFDTTKGKKISRFYVIKLQERVRALETELGQYTDEDHEYPRSNEDMVRPGGLVRLNDTDETPRYLGPSSGIAMTRLLMEEAKLFTDSKRISELIPEVRVRRQGRMQSIQMGHASNRKKSYPMISDHPAQTLPTKPIASKLVDIFCQRSQVFWPTLHEKVFLKELEEVYDGDKDPYKNFIVRIVFAISLQKLDTQYAGLADSYYLAAMQFFEEVVRPKDLKTLQCLALIGQYSLLTPTRTAVYYIVGLASRIVLQEGLADEKTIINGYSLGLIDPLTLDMRRRLAYIVASMEFGLAHSMGRPNCLAKSEDAMDVEYFATVDDEYITEEGILPGPPSEKKLVAIHFFKMRMAQAEIRRILYEKKRPEPKDENHPWFAKMDSDIQTWIDQSPQNPAWCKPWFTGRYHQMRISLYRPSPQVPKPSARGASICYDGAAYIINLSKQQMEKAAVDITWVFLLNLYMAINTLLWTVSYPEIRQAHAREEVEELVDTTLDIMDQCTDRWPGTASASQLYGIFAKACMQSYDAQDTPTIPSSSTFNSPRSVFDTSSPQGSENSSSTGPQQQQQSQYNLNRPTFGYVFDATPESMNTFNFDNNYPPPQPTFRSNSIFFNPGTNESTGRRFSYFPPDFTQPGETSPHDPPPSGASGAGSMHSSASPPNHMLGTLPTPPESLVAQTASGSTPPTSSVSPPEMSEPTPTLSRASPALLQSAPVMIPPNINAPLSQKLPAQPQPPQRGPTFTIPPMPQQSVPQRSLPPPTTISDWFSPPPPFISPYAFSSISNSFFGDSPQLNGFAGGQGPGLGIGQFGGGHFNYASERHGSLTQEQQLELMGVLESDGPDDIDAFLNMGGGGGGGTNNQQTSQWR